MTGKKEDHKEMKCFNCGAECSLQDFCHGCKEYICDKCDVSQGNMPGRHHPPQDHLITWEEE